MIKKRIKIGLLTTTIVVLVLFAGALLRVGTESLGPTENDTEIVEVILGDSTIPVELADTVETRQQGLSKRDALPDGSGMLFIFPESYIYGFWMKDMLFALDMIWLDADGCIIDIFEDVSPDTYPTIFRPSSPALLVLEVSSGFVEAQDISVGMCASFNLE